MKAELITGWLPRNRRTALVTATAMTIAIALADFVAVRNVSLELLYFIPIVVSAAYLTNFEIVTAALLCTFLHELMSPSAGGAAVRVITSFIAYLGIGALVREMDQHGKAALTYARQLAAEVERREATEQQLLGLLDGIPAAILTLNANGKVLLANEAAYELFGREPESLVGKAIDEYLPDVARLRQTSGVRRLVRTMIEGTGYRDGGQPFLAHIWISSYGPPSATGLTVVAFDASEQLRSHEEIGLYSLTTSAHIIMSAFWHEARNLSSGMRMLITNLMHRPAIAESEELQGLKSLVDSLEKLAYGEQPSDDHTLDTASVRVVLDHLRIIIEPSFQEKQTAVYWRIAEDMPLVCADHHGLLQVFLNLARNASRALENSPRKELRIIGEAEHHRVKVRFHNSGPPIEDPENLFKPFQPGASERGLGLYVSRAIVRSFGGDLIYEPVTSGCSFAVLLQISKFWSTYGVASHSQEDSRPAG